MGTSLAWAAFASGVVGTFVTGRHRVGWLIGASAAGCWLAFGLVIHQPAEILASSISIVLSIRNFYVWNRP